VTELLEHVLEMGCDRSAGDEQPLGDLTVGETGDDEVDDLQLGRRETPPAERRASRRTAGAPHTELAQHRLDPVSISNSTETLVHRDCLVQQRDCFADQAGPTKRHAGVLARHCQLIWPRPIPVDGDRFEEWSGVPVEQTTAAQGDPTGRRRPAEWRTPLQLFSHCPGALTIPGGECDPDEIGPTSSGRRLQVADGGVRIPRLGQRRQG
jgi:hypothetical protein